ncbi:MAG: manganese efflux pump, partial [Firmicutes bacterium]|nr:manganese efflux pump [Bacillota bacterium]
MQLGEIILLGVALSMDAFAVSAVSAMTIKNIQPRDMLLLAAAFGLFQGLMPLIGYFAGTIFWSGHLANLLACALLCLLGGKMLTD